MITLLTHSLYSDCRLFHSFSIHLPFFCSFVSQFVCEFTHIVEVYNFNFMYYGIVRNFICSLSDDSEEKAEDEQQEDNPVENDSSEDEPSDDAEGGDSGI